MRTTNRLSVDCKLVSGHTEALEHGPGAFYFASEGPEGRADAYILIFIPGDEGPRVIPIGAAGAPKEDKRWQWDGNREKPTLTPSIQAWGIDDTPEDDPTKPMPQYEVWHGFLTAGRLVSC